MEALQGVHQRLEAGIQGKLARAGRIQPERSRAEMGEAVQRGHRELAVKPEQAKPVLQIPRTHQKDRLHHQYRGGLPPNGSEGNQVQRGFYLGHGYAQACVSRNNTVQ